MTEPLNYHQATPSIATSGQPTRGELHQIAEQGYEAVVNLAMHDSDNAIPEEGNLCASLGMAYFNLPVPFDEPTAQQLRDFVALMELLAGRKVWVHCAVNARVSAFMYQYLTQIQGYAPKEATSPLLAKWQGKMDDAWQGFMAIRLGAD